MLAFQAQCQIKYQNLVGEWILTKVTNEKDGTPANGKYSIDNSYQRFTFEKNKILRPSSAPFESGFGIYVILKGDEFKLSANDLPIFNEGTFKILKVDSERLSLSTVNEQGETIIYYFVNAKFLNSPSDITFENVVIDNYFYQNTRGQNTSNKYYLTMDNYQFNVPRYKQSYFCSRLSDVVKYKPDKNESFNLVFQLILDSQGKVNSVNMLEGKNAKIDKRVINFLQKTKWQFPNDQFEHPVSLTFDVQFNYVFTNFDKSVLRAN
ncbi:hypothetical protein [Reichenbachiella sp.]|uniref:hypothetical protein n=1 Tax=Reichenbachiella sp. TaxID=2184521 RepID=UPI003B5A43E8